LIIYQRNLINKFGGPVKTKRTVPDCRTLLSFFLITLFLRGAGEFKNYGDPEKENKEFEKYKYFWYN